MHWWPSYKSWQNYTHIHTDTGAYNLGRRSLGHWEPRRFWGLERSRGLTALWGNENQRFCFLCHCFYPPALAAFPRADPTALTKMKRDFLPSKNTKHSTTWRVEDIKITRLYWSSKGLARSITTPWAEQATTSTNPSSTSHPKVLSAQKKKRLSTKYFARSTFLRLTGSHFHACRWLQWSSNLKTIISSGWSGSALPYLIRPNLISDPSLHPPHSQSPTISMPSASCWAVVQRTGQPWDWLEADQQSLPRGSTPCHPLQTSSPPKSPALAGCPLNLVCSCLHRLFSPSPWARSLPTRPRHPCSSWTHWASECLSQ